MKKILKIIIITIVLFIIILFGINYYIKYSTKNNIVTINNLDNYEAIVVLGAGLKNGNPSPILKDRLDKALEAYENKASSKIIVSGDHTAKDYDEVNVMKNYLMENGVPSSNIFMDHAGISTYDSIYRIKEIFGLKKILIITQEYHLYRSLYIAKSLGLNASGLSATIHTWNSDSVREAREILARDKDFFKCIYKPTSKYLGDKINIEENGEITNG